MSDIPSILLRAAVSLVGSVMGIFQIFHAVDRHLSDQSTVGRSRVDREADEWREMVILHWQWMAFGLLVLAGLLGCGYWLLFF